jgi:outer membrane protein OmpA-like peptidoglycan-associated protein
LEADQQKLAGQQDELQNSHQQVRTQVGQLQSDQDQMKTDLQRTREETAMLGKRISQLDDYETRDSAKINFAMGKATLTSEGKAALDAIAEKALATEGYLIEVSGFTDSTGSEMHNHELSRRRAEVVVDYLTVVKEVPIRRLLTPIGFGESRPVADNSTRSGRAENRRTEVKILVNRAMAKNQ